jgi:hypothetical protein
MEGTKAVTIFTVSIGPKTTEDISAISTCLYFFYYPRIHFPFSLKPFYVLTNHHPEHFAPQAGRQLNPVSGKGPS